MAESLQLPNHAIAGASSTSLTAADKTDILEPIQRLLQGLYLLGTEKDYGDPGGFFSSPPESIAILEAGASTATKAWTSAAGRGRGRSDPSTWIPAN